MIVHRPDLAHERLSPTNCHELLFDDVIWVRRARQEHDAFVDLMRERGVEVLLFHELLAETLEDAGRARVGARPAAAARGGDRDVLRRPDRLDDGDAGDELATRLTGGVTVAELPDEIASVVARRDAPDRLRDRAAAEPALHARHERLDLRRRVDQPHVLAGAPARDAQRRGRLPLPPALPRCRLPDLVRRRSTTTGAARRSRAATSCRSATASSSSARASGRTARAVSILAQNLFAADAARLVIGALMPRERAAMHLDTVFTFCDRDVVTIYEPVVVADPAGALHARTATAASAPRSRSGRSSRRSRTRSGSSDLKVVTTAGDEFEAERNQWDDGNNVVALAPGVVVAYERNEATNAKLAHGGRRGARDRRPGARPRPRRRPLHDLSSRSRRLKGDSR